MITDRIEALLQKEQWEKAQIAIEKQLRKEPEDHWLWARLSGVKYERHDYEGALMAAEKARELVPDCPLANWSYANAVETLGNITEALRWYARLLRHGFQQLQQPDADANECWEGPEWTLGLLTDCLFRIGGCLAIRVRNPRAKKDTKDAAIEAYQRFLELADLGVPTIYSREDALQRLRGLLPSREAKLRAAVRSMEKMELAPG